MQSDMIDLTLKDMEDLNNQFQKLVPAVVNSLRDEKQTASITITVSFQLREDSDTLLDMSTKIKPTFASEKKSTLCRRDLAGNLKADAWGLGKAAIRKDGSLFAGISDTEIADKN